MVVKTNERDAAGAKAEPHIRAHVLIIEPIAKRLVTWWPQWQEAFAAAGGRSDEWRFKCDLPERQRQLGRAAGLDPRELTARSLWM